jgi:asparagine synthetase B (glutamine-hydrolysing)
MNSINNIGPPRNHLLGWLAIATSDHRNDIGKNIDRGLNAFVGDYGSLKSIQTKGSFGFGIRQPDTPLPLTTWSFFSDEDGICFVEGVFYDRYFSHQPVDGEDQRLAKILLKHFRAEQTKAIEELSGSFSGFIFDRKEKRLITFVDRLSTRVLYWSHEDDNVIVSSNLAAFRALKTLRLDQQGAFQSLTIGFPVGERTLLKDVKIQPPATINIFQDGKNESLRYWSPPRRTNGISLHESCVLITNSMEEYAERIYNRAKQTIALGLSGGHDSRVILSALAYKNIPFEAITWNDGNFNDRVAEKLCAVIKKPSRVVKNLPDSGLTPIRQDGFVYSDGYYFYPTGFSRLAKECSERHIQVLMIGFAGDVISGATLSYPAPQYLSTIDQLARHTLESNQMDYLSFELAHSILKNANPSLTDETTSEWLQSFSEHDSRESFLDISILQGLANREFKRVRFAIAPAAQHAQILFPYLDNKVLDTYFSLPLKALKHRVAHCYAAFYRFKEFGKYQAGGYPISLRNEALFSHGLYLTKSCVSRLKSSLTPFQSFNHRRKKNDRYNNIFKEISRSSLVDVALLKELFLNGEIAPRSLYKIHTLTRFSDFYLHGDNSQLPQRLLSR